MRTENSSRGEDYFVIPVGFGRGNGEHPNIYTHTLANSLFLYFLGEQEEFMAATQ